MDDQILSVAQEIALNAYASETGQNDRKNFDPATIALILEVALQVAKVCLKLTKDANTVLKAGHQRSILARFAIRRAISGLEENGKRINKDEVINTVLRMSDVATSEQLWKFVA